MGLTFYRLQEGSIKQDPRYTFSPLGEGCGEEIV